MKTDNYKRTNRQQFETLLNRSGEHKNLHIIDIGTFYRLSTRVTKISDSIIEGKLDFIETRFNGITFENCDFKNEILFENNEFYGHTIMKNCSFSSEVCFFNSSLQKLQLIDCNFNKIIFKGFINGIKQDEGQIIINAGSFEDIDFKTTEINCPLTFQSSYIDVLSFSKTNVNKSLSFDKNLQINRLFLVSSNFNDRIDFYHCSISNQTYIHKSSFFEQVVFQRNCYNHWITFADIYSKHNISIDFDNNLETIDISDCNFEKSLNCHSLSKKMNNDITGIMCTISGVIHGNIIFEGIPVTYLSIGAINFGNLFFDKIRTRSIFLQNFRNNNKLTISNIVQDKDFNLLLIYDSNINDTEFINIDFKKFDEVVIAKSNVSSLLLSNSLFPNKIQVHTNEPNLGYKIEEHEKINKHIYYRDTYRQLKIAMEKQKNRNSSLIYKAQEMHYLRKELNFGWDKVLLYMNYISNNHGISWLRGVIFTISIAFIFFCFYNETLSSPFFRWDSGSTLEETKIAFWVGLDAFSNFISTFPKLRLDDNSNTWQTNLSVLLSRVFIGYGIYQTIMAFRKYGGNNS